MQKMKLNTGPRSPKLPEPSAMHFVVIAMITLASVLSITSIPPAFPEIAKYFAVDEARIGILMGVYTLPGIFLTPLYGYFADKYSRKAVLFPALIVYASFGIACAFAESFEILVLFRLIQGIGSAPLGALNISLLGDIYRGDRLAKNTGLNSMILSIGTATFPLVGGLLARESWELPFLLAAFGFVVAVFYLGYFKNIKQKPENIRPSELLASLFNRNRQSLEYPVSRQFRKIALFNMLTFFLLIGALFTYIPDYLNGQFGFDPAERGKFLFAMSISAAVSAGLLKQFIGKIGHANLIKIQFAVFAVVFFLMPLADVTGAYLLIILFGLGYGINMPSMQLWVLKIATNRKRAIFTALHRAVSQIGQTIGPIIVGFLLAEFTAKGDFTLAFNIGAAISVASLILAFIVLRDIHIENQQIHS